MREQEDRLAIVNKAFRWIDSFMLIALKVGISIYILSIIIEWLYDTIMK